MTYSPARVRRVTLTAAVTTIVGGALLVAPGGAIADTAFGPGHGSGFKSVRLLGEKQIPFGTKFADTEVGGLSGIDYAPRSHTWYLQSDDRSQRQAARFYTAKVDISSAGVLKDVKITGTKPLLNPAGKPYPPITANDGTTVDPEDMRVDPLTGQLIWSQEGDRQAATADKPAVLIQPSIRSAKTNGAFVKEMKLPATYKMSLPEEKGPRQNYVIEGFTFAGGGTRLVTALEGPRYEDGPLATTEKGAVSRLTVFDRHSRQLSEYAYQQEPLFAAPNPPGSSGETGVPAILNADPVDPSKLLVLERSYVAGTGNKVRIYQVDTRGATDVKKINALPGGRKVKLAKKKLLVDLSTLKLGKVDNIEGMTWGPRLRTGERTLVLVSDNNFNNSQITQFVALAVR